MTQFSSGAAENLKEAKLPRRDWILLPLVGVLTICFIAVCVELIARRVFSESAKTLASCFVMNDPLTGVRGIPNSVCREKGPETQWIESRFNSCGYLAGMECGPKQPGHYRIVMTGSSVAVGEHVQREQTFAALLPEELSRQTGHTIELYNESMGFGFSHSTALRFNDVLTAQPDMILWILTPMDIEGGQLGLPSRAIANWNNQSLAAKAWFRIKTSFNSGSMSDAVSQVFGRTRTSLLLRHYLYESQSQYVKAYLMESPEITDFLRAEPSPTWKMRLQKFADDAADMEARAKAAGVPFVAVYIPNRAQTAMISMGHWQEGFDPYRLDNDLRSIITSHGGTYLEILPDFRNIPNPEQYYLPVDGHPNISGHALLSKLLAKALTSGPTPALSVAAQPKAAPEQKR